MKQAMPVVDKHLMAADSTKEIDKLRRDRKEALSAAANAAEKRPLPPDPLLWLARWANEAPTLGQAVRRLFGQNRSAIEHPVQAGKVPDELTSTSAR